MGRRRDALLALVVLLPAAAAVVALDAPVTPFPVAVGAAALALEALLSLRAARVRAVWERPAVQATAVALGIGLLAVAASLLGPAAATVLAAGLCAYLLLLAAVTLRDALGRTANAESRPSNGRRPRE